MAAFTLQEYRNMFSMYVKTKDVREARREYKKKYPCRLLPDVETFIIVYKHFVEFGNFTEYLVLKKDPVFEKEQMEYDIVELMKEDPTISNRRLKDRLSKSIKWSRRN